MSLAEIWYSLRDSAVDRTVFSPPVVEDPLTEANEMYQNAGEQGRRQDDSDEIRIGAKFITSNYLISLHSD
jgi:hypothetical protein